MSEQQRRKAQQRGPKKAGIGGAPKKEKDDNYNYIVIPDSDMKIYYKDIEDTRTNLRGGGICKKGMNKKARGVNS